MGSLVDDAAVGPPEPHRPRARIDVWLDSLGDEDRAAALRVLADPAWSHVEACRLFARHGLVVSDVQVGKWRRVHGSG
ncbi:MAG: type I-F CRISPR-associated protein Csy1 [Bifidobacteriaceae bacterium]|nr:type I-F CRISPR-associated protein Csy1 [Bifidobacteriaceae bacterium]